MDASVKGKECHVGALRIVQLGKYRKCFHDEKAFGELVAELECSAVGGMALLLNGEEPLAGMVPAQEAGEAMRQRILRRLLENPMSLEEIQTRLGDDEVIEHGTLE